MTWENLTADADALRQELGFEKWAVLGHSFGGHVALEYALRYPDSLSHLVLLDTGGDSRWSQQNAPELLAKRGYSPKIVKLARRFLNGQIAPKEFVPALMRLGSAYNPHTTLLQLAREMIQGEWRTKPRAEAHIFARPHLIKGWAVMDRLGEINVPTLVMAGRDDFLFPPELRLSSPLESPTRDSGSSSALATTRTRSSLPRSCRLCGENALGWLRGLEIGRASCRERV